MADIFESYVQRKARKKKGAPRRKKKREEIKKKISKMGILGAISES